LKRTSAESHYQEIAAELSVGDLVVPYGQGTEYSAGRIVALWPGIGMAEVQYSRGNRRYPVEDLVRLNADRQVDPPSQSNSVPGGLPNAVVSGGPNPSRVAHAFIKRALYWAARDRKYRPTRAEAGAGTYCCPKCGGDATLRRTTYGREDGRNVKLLACPECLFLIREDDVLIPESEV
jgi:hypothetical protein